MLFNSDIFLKFFAAFLLLYYLVRNHLPTRNLLMVTASYVFYGWWDYRFLGLLLASSLLDFSVGLGLGRATAAATRRRWLALSLAGNLGMLGFFKYYNFFVDSFVHLLTQIGVEAHPRTLQIVLPVGISFYTFQTLSYALDVYRGQMHPTRNLLNFLAYVSFFPQLVAGPIERASHLLPQFERTALITPASLRTGLWLVVWGMFKKVVVADNLAPLVDLVYQNPAASGPLVLGATLAFAFQIYGDFSGYSDIARGLAHILGFDLRWNFRLPYLAGNIREFWRRWHMSLSTWLRDYLYISLGGNRQGTLRTHFNLLATMFLGGLWHGAAWNFALWGLWHGAGLVVHRWWSNRHPGQEGRPSLAGWLATFLFVLYGWLLFRSESLSQIVLFTRNLANLTTPEWTGSYILNLAVFASPVILMQLWQSRTGNMLAPLSKPTWVLAGLQALLILAICQYWEKEATPFIYFQF